MFGKLSSQKHGEIRLSTWDLGIFLYWEKGWQTSFFWISTVGEYPKFVLESGRVVIQDLIACLFSLSHVVAAPHHLGECILDYCLLWYSRANDCLLAYTLENRLLWVQVLHCINVWVISTTATFKASCIILKTNKQTIPTKITLKTTMVFDF